MILIGLPASGKSSFYKQYFFDTHLRLSLDLLRTQHREQRFFQVALETQTRLVIDKTNASRAERALYLGPLRQAGYKVRGYYFQSRIEDCLARNAQRSGKARIPDAGVRGTAGRLELPVIAEGFEQLFYVSLVNQQFVVEEWRDDL